MGAVNWPRNVNFYNTALGKIEGVSNTSWLGFLDALGKVEGDDSYSAVNDKGYVGIYQFSPFDDRYSIFKTLDFSNNIGAMLGVISDEAFRANPIAQELAALMEFSGTAPTVNPFSSAYQYARSAAGGIPGFSRDRFDQMVDQTFTIQWTDSTGVWEPPQQITLTQAGISTATHLVGQGGVAYGMSQIYRQAYDADGNRIPNPTIILNVNASIQLKSGSAYLADGSGIAFSTYVELFSEFNISPLIAATDAQFNELARQLITYRREKILAYLEATDGELSMSMFVGTTSYRETLLAVINGLALPLPLDYLDRTNGEVVVGFSSGTTLVGSGQDDLIFGQGGNDTLVGQSGDDVLYGGTGNDTLRGDTGSDIYVFNANEGKDTIQDADGSGSVLVGAGGMALRSGSTKLNSAISGNSGYKAGP